MQVSKQDVYERIAQLMLLDVPQRQIAQAVNLSEGRVSQILQDEEFKAILSQKSLEHHEQQKAVNEGWDTLEALAISGLMKHMEVAADPNLMLRVASVANKATRRGQYVNNPLNVAGAAGARVVINLGQVFVNKLQNAQYEVNMQPVVSTQAQKQTDVMALPVLEKMLQASGLHATAELPELDEVLTQADLATL